ncbi:hypothetical protein [Clostridium sp. C8-1-8]|uniref:hypothetical protein n=1 Tax=Clostridium sp. C8-1-8 TaxID=2698831 RepID=UPI001370376B|nr:hypothetical protein [Clostridium sp. C8-1-8]
MGKRGRKQKFEGIDINKQVVYAIWVKDFVYIGSGYYERLSGNLSKVKRGVHANKELQDAYNIHQFVKLEILEHDIETDLEARDLENFYMDYFKKIDGVVVCNKVKAYVSNYKRSLDPEDVIKIRELINEGKKNGELAELYNVSATQISRIRNNRRWPNI